MWYGGDKHREQVGCKGTMNGMGEDKACADVRLSTIRPLYKKPEKGKNLTTLFFPTTRKEEFSLSCLPCGTSKATPT